MPGILNYFPNINQTLYYCDSPPSMVYARHANIGWAQRKIIALPAAVWTGLIVAAYHLADAILHKCLRNHAVALIQINAFKRDLGNAYDWLMILFFDSNSAKQQPPLQAYDIPKAENASSYSKPSVPPTYSTYTTHHSFSPNAYQANVHKAQNFTSNIPSSFNDKKQQALNEVRLSGSNLKNLSYEMRDNEEVVITAINNSNLPVIKDATYNMKSNKKVALATVRKNGLWLEHLSYEMQDNNEVVAAAVKNNKSAYTHASFAQRRKYQPPFYSAPQAAGYGFNNRFSASQGPFRTNAAPSFNSGYSRFNSDPLRDFFAHMHRGAANASKEPSPPPKVEWSCPAELKEDNSEVAVIFKRILKTEHDNSSLLNSKNLTKAELKTTLRSVFCNMLGLATTCSDQEMTASYRKLSLKIHPDKCSHMFAEKAYMPLSAIKNRLDHL